MSFKDCINTAVRNGSLKAAKASQATALYDRIYNAEIAAGATPGDAAYKAMLDSAKVITQLKGAEKWAKIKSIQAAHRLTQLVDSAGDRPEKALAAIIQGSETLSGARGIEARQSVIRGQLHARITKGLEKYRPRLAGVHRPKAGHDDLVEESFALGSSGNASAKEIMQEFLEAAAEGRKLANAAGANMGDFANSKKLNTLPQRHDTLRVSRAGKDTWVQQHMGWLDWNEMAHFNDGLPILPSDRVRVLESVYESIVTQGDIKLKPGVPQRQNLAKQLSHKRFLHYKDAASWRAANKLYGSEDVFASMVSYLDTLAHDVALLQTMGPSPSGMRDFAATLVRKRAAELDRAGGDGRSHGSKADAAITRFEETFNVLVGGSAVDPQNRLAYSLQGVRNTLTASLLGSAAIAAVPGDLMLAKHAMLFNKMPETQLLKRYMELLTDKKARDVAVQSGLVAEGATAIALGAQRMIGDISGPAITNRVTDFVMRATFMTPHTQAIKWAWGMEFMGMLGRLRSTPFDQLPIKEMFERNGIDSAMWDKFRNMPAYRFKDSEFLRPVDALASSDQSLRDIGLRIGDMIQYEMKNGIVESSAYAKSWLVGRTEPGTFSGEVLRSAALFRNFPVTILLNQSERFMARKGAANKIGYALGLATTLTIAGAIAVQAGDIAAGRDPMDMTTGKFWQRAALKGGGLGILGDFIFADYNKYGQGVADVALGAPASFVTDAGKLTLGNAAQIFAGEDTNIKSEAVTFASRYTPGTSIWWAKLALRRLAWDNLQELADPNAYRKFRQQEKMLQEQYGQSSWWKPGENAPSDAPDLRKAVGQ